MRHLRHVTYVLVGLLAAGAVPAVSAEESPAVTVSTTAAGPDTRTNLEKLSDPNPFVRRNAAILLGSEKKKENVPALLNLLGDENIEVRRAAISALGNTGDKRAAAPLMAAFKTEKNINAQMDIIIALGDIRNPSSALFLQKLLKDPYPVFRSEALRALGKINAPDTHQAMISMLKDEAEGVRVIAADTAGQLKLSGAAPQLIKNLADPAAIVRRSSAQALGVVGGGSAVPELQKLIEDKDASVAKAAREAIANIEKKGAGAQKKPATGK